MPTVSLCQKTVGILPLQQALSRKGQNRTAAQAFGPYLQFNKMGLYQTPGAAITRLASAIRSNRPESAKAAASKALPV